MKGSSERKSGLRFSSESSPRRSAETRSERSGAAAIIGKILPFFLAEEGVRLGEEERGLLG